MKEIVKYDNWLNLLSFKTFDAGDFDFLMAICSKAKEQGTHEIRISFDELRKLSGYTDHSNKRTEEKILGMNEKLLGMKCRVSLGSKVSQFVLFYNFETDFEEKVLTVSVNEKFRFLLNDLVRCFTVFDLEVFVGLKSKYSKNLFRLLSQFKATGNLMLNNDDFRKRMGIPESYQTKFVVSRIIKPSIEELSVYFPRLSYAPIRTKGRGRTITGWQFDFTPIGVEEKAAKTEPRKRRTKFHNFEERRYDYAALEKALLEG